MISNIKKYIFVFVLAVSAFWVSGQDPESNEAAITGVVLNSENNQPIPGVAVTIPGIASSITDDEGRFRLRQTDEGAVIQVRIPGFAYKEVVLGHQKELTIVLHDESFKTVYKQTGSPFGSIDWLTTTASSTTISNKENYKKAIISSENLVQDEGLGVNTLLRSGAQGSGGNMYLRGFTSINASNQPMILIDGIPYENSVISPSLVSGNLITPLTGIDVKDIERITILKDATSIYGSKGANGVILIETAKAQEQATRIDFHAYAGVNLAPSNLYQMMNPWEYRTYLGDILSTSGQYTTSGIQALPYINQEKPEVKPWGIEGNKDYYRYNQDTDWQKEIFRNSLSQNYYMSIKGGDDVALYALSVGYLNHDGIIENTGFSRYNTQFNSQINVAKWLKMSTNMNFSYSDRSLAYEGISPNFNPMYVSLVKAPFMGPYLYNELGIQTPNFELADVFGVTNPAALVDESTSINNKTYRFFGNIGATAALGEHFDLNATFGVTFDKTRENIFLPQKGLQHDTLSSGLVTNEMQASVSRYLQYYVDASLGYHREFDRKHSVRAHLGGRYQINSTESDWIYAYNSSSDDMKSVGNGNLDLASASGRLGDWKWMSFYLNGEYGYMNRYFLALNMAVDGSSRFGKDADGLKMFGNIFGVFPSVTGAWLISSEDFMSRVKMIDLLKLRLGYTVAGNDDIGNYTSRVLYSSENLLGYYGLVRDNIANPELKWETNTKINAGLDVALFNERLSLSFDVFQSRTTDLLTWNQGKGIYGIKQYAVNDGTMRNRGFELGLQGRIINAAFKWDMGINVARYKNEVTALSGEKITEIAGAEVLTRVGNPVGVFYGYKTDGVYATSAEATAAGLNIRRGDGTLIPFQAGDIRFVNQNNDNVINEDDKTIIGDPNPDFYGSIVNRMQWKRWTLNAVFTFSYGNDIYNSVRAGVESMTGTQNQTVQVINRWSRDGHVTSTPRAVWGDPMDNSRFSDRWIEDGSYIRLKNISISYDIPIRMSVIKGIQVYVTGNNLLTLTRYLGYDPEFSTLQSPLGYGIDMGMTPQPRSVLFGVKIGL